MNIRKLTPADAAVFREIRLTALQSDSPAFGSSYDEEKDRTAEQFAAWLQSSSDSMVFGAFVDERLVGMVGLARENKNKTRHKAVIWGMFTQREFRARGIGKELMSAAMAAARQMEGLEQVNLCVAANNEPAKWLYRFFGFRPFGYERNAMKENGHYIDEEHWTAFLDAESQA